MVHVGAVLLKGEFVFEGVTWFDRFLSQAGHTIHAVRKEYPVPMNSGRSGEFVGDVNSDVVALDGFDGRAVNLSVETPAVCHEAGGEFVIRNFLGDEMIDFYAANNFPRQSAAVWCYDRAVALVCVLPGV